MGPGSSTQRSSGADCFSYFSAPRVPQALCHEGQFHARRASHSDGPGSHEKELLEALCSNPVVHKTWK